MNVGEDIQGNFCQQIQTRLENITTAIRSALSLSTIHKGYSVFDTDLGKPCWWDGSQWIILPVGTGVGYYATNTHTLTKTTVKTLTSGGGNFAHAGVGTNFRLFSYFLNSSNNSIISDVEIELSNETQNQGYVDYNFSYRPFLLPATNITLIVLWSAI